MAAILCASVPAKNQPRPPRVVYTVQLTPSTREAVDAFSDRTGLPKTVMLERLTAWFQAQPWEIQTAIMDGDPDVRRQAAATVIARMAGLDRDAKLSAAVDLDLVQSLEAVQALTARALAEARATQIKAKPPSKP